MPKPKAIALNRRTILAAAGAATAALAAPRILRAQGKELVVGGAASHKNFVETIIAPVFEKKYGCKIVYEGTRSLVNLEKMQKNKDKQYLSVVQMDDPVMILAVKEGLLEAITPAKVPNIAALKPGTIHMDGMWVELPAALARHRLQSQSHEDGPDVVGRRLRSQVQGPRDPAVAAEHRGPGQPVHGGLPRHRQTDARGAEGHRCRLQEARHHQAQPADGLHADAAGLQSAGAGRRLHDLERASRRWRWSASRPARRSTSPRRRKASSPCRRAWRW